MRTFCGGREGGGQRHQGGDGDAGDSVSDSFCGGAAVGVMVMEGG